MGAYGDVGLSGGSGERALARLSGMLDAKLEPYFNSFCFLASCSVMALVGQAELEYAGSRCAAGGHRAEFLKEIWEARPAPKDGMS